MADHIVIVGGDAAGMSAASKLRRVDPKARITVLEREQVISYGACGMPYHLDGRIADPESLLVRSPDDFKRAGVDVRIQHEVTEIDVDKSTVTVLDRIGSGISKIQYDRLLVATGANAILPDIPGVSSSNVFLFRKYADLLKIAAHLAENSCANITVIGGGYIGLEVAEALTERGCSITLVESEDALMPRSLDVEMAAHVQRELELRGVEVRLGTKVEELLTRGDKVAQVQSSAGTWDCDVVIVAAGVRPSSWLAESAGIEIDEFRAIKTDLQLRTSIGNVFAAGDCTSTRSTVSGKRVWIPLGPLANKQGRVAGSNLAGESRTFNGVAGTSFVNLFRLQVGRTGLTESEALTLGFDVKTAIITAGDTAPYYPGGEDTTVKLIADALDGRILGGQITGFKGVAGRTNVIATALQARMDVDSFLEVDLGYAPQFAPVWDPLLVAANQL